MDSDSIKAFLFGMVKESGKNGKPHPLPETPSTGDRDDGGEVVNSEGTPEPETSSELEVFRRYSPKEPPMIAPDMPDYAKFCTGYTARSCEHCPHYVNSGTGLFCQMWEDVYPGAVTWYPAD